MTHLQECVGPAVDADEQWPLLLEVPAASEQVEVALVVDAAHDHEDVTVTEVDRDVGDVRLVDEQVTLALDVVERVLGEALELVAHVGARFLEDRLERVHVLTGSRRDFSTIAEDTSSLDDDLVAVVDRGHHVGSDAVHHRHTRRG